MICFIVSHFSIPNLSTSRDLSNCFYLTRSLVMKWQSVASEFYTMALGDFLNLSFLSHYLSMIIWTGTIFLLKSFSFRKWTLVFYMLLIVLHFLSNYLRTSGWDSFPSYWLTLPILTKSTTDRKKKLLLIFFFFFWINIFQFMNYILLPEIGCLEMVK